MTPAEIVWTVGAACGLASFAALLFATALAAAAGRRPPSPLTQEPIPEIVCALLELREAFIEHIEAHEAAEV